MIRTTLLCALLTLALPLSGFGQDTKADTKTASGQTQGKKKGTKSPKSAPASTPQASAVSVDEAQQEFAAFVVGFVEKLNRVHHKGITRMQVTKLPDGTYSARYHAIDPSTIETQVKPTGHPVSPFVGTLKYVEKVYEATGPTAQAAQSAPFAVVDSLRVTELFSRASKGWD